MKKLLFLISMIILTGISSSAQWGLVGVSGRTNATVPSIGIGTFTAAPSSRLHVNNFLCNTPSGGLNGLLFRTDGDQLVDNRWQLFTGTSSTSLTERFRIRTFANSFDTWLERTQVGSEADLRLLTAEVQLRARNKRLGDFCELAGALADEVIMGDGTDVNFTALSSTNRRLFLHGTNGFLGLGSNFAEGAINPNYHFHIHESLASTAVYQQFTNGTAGSALTDGLRIGLNPTISYEIRSFDNGIWLDIAQSDTIRMRFRDIPTYTGLNDLNYGAVSRIMVPLRAADANVAPMSMMQLGTNQVGNIDRNWMNVGTTYATNQDAMYVGWMERANPDVSPLQSDAIIAWGCQRGTSNNSPASDNFRIIFLEPDNFFTPNADSAGAVQGKEVFRIEPFSGNVGIGNYSQTSTQPPGNANYVGAKLDIDGDLRIRTVPQDNALNQVLVRDPADLGRVHWRDAATLGGACDWNIVNAGQDLATGFPGACVEGNTGVGLSTPLAKLEVFRPQSLPGVTNATGFKVRSEDVTLNVPLLYTAFGLVSEIDAPNRFNHGVHSTATGGDSNWGGTFIGHTSTSTSVGVSGFAYGGAGNVGVRGIVNGYASTDLNEAGRFQMGINGATNNRGVTGICTPGADDYAGYFDGDIIHTGTINGISDSLLKTSVSTLTGTLDIINSLRPVSYLYNSVAHDCFEVSDEKQIGLIAQNVEAVLPLLVKNNHNPAEYDENHMLVSPEISFKSVNYIGLIPVLIGAIKEQQGQINSLITQLNSCCNTSMETRSAEGNTEITQQNVHLSNKSIVLNQNVPNPFAEQTIISYNINEDFSKAQILFYDANGRLIQATDITTKGAGQLNIFADDLTTGVYSYALVVDGRVIETKKMVKQ